VDRRSRYLRRLADTRIPGRRDRAETSRPDAQRNRKFVVVSAPDRQHIDRDLFHRRYRRAEHVRHGLPRPDESRFFASSRVPAPGRQSREPLESTRDVTVQYLHQRDGPSLLEVELHGLPVDDSEAAQHVADGGEPGDRRRIDVRPLAA
jgi:hypothetical protein